MSTGARRRWVGRRGGGGDKRPRIGAMAAVAPAAMTMAMSAGPGGSRDASAGVRVEVLTPARFEGAAKVFNDFMSRGKGGCVGLCPYSWCPMSTDDFSKLYREYPDTLSTTAVAVREADDAVVGTIRLSVYGQPRSSGDEEIHKLKPGEVCAVSLRAWALTS